MSKYEDLVEQVRELGGEDIADQLDGFSGSSLRQKAEKTDRLETENATLKAEIAKRDAAPKIEKAFKDAGVDFDQLRPAEKQALQSLSVEDIGDENKVASFITANELPLIAAGNQAQGQQQQADPPPNAAAVVQAARNAPQNQTSSPVYTPADIASWDQPSRIAFEREFPEEAEAVRNGHEVTAPGFTPVMAQVHAP